MKLLKIAVTCGLLAVAGTAHAAKVTVTGKGTVNNDSFSGAAVGSPVSFNFDYDTDAVPSLVIDPDGDGHPIQYGYYDGTAFTSPLTITSSIGTFITDFTTFVSAYRQADDLTHFIFAGFGAAQPSLTGSLDFTAKGALSPKLPSSFALDPGYYAGGGVSTSDFGFNFSIDSITTSGSIVAAVPEASTWLMMILGIGMAGATVRARKKAPAYATV